MVFLRFMPSNGIAESYGSSIFSFLRNLHIVLHSGSIYLHSHQQYKRIPSTLSPVFVVCRLFDNGHSEWCEVIFHCSFDLHSLIISDVEYLFMCFLAICMSSLEKYPFRSFTHLLTGLFVFCYVELHELFVTYNVINEEHGISLWPDLGVNVPYL